MAQATAGIAQSSALAASLRPSACPVPFQSVQPCGRSVHSGATSKNVDAGCVSSSSNVLDRRTAMILTSSLVASYFQLHRSPVAKAQEGGGGSSDPSNTSTSSSRGLSRYIRKKKLDPLDTYVPMVLSAQAQLLKAGDVMVSDAAEARNLLRQGAFSGVRDNIRALGEYAVNGGQAAAAAELVPGFFNALNEYDRVLLTAIKGDKLDLEKATADHAATVRALDSLLATVPADVLDRSRNILTQTIAKSNSKAGGTDDAEDKLLGSLLAQ